MFIYQKPVLIDKIMAYCPLWSSAFEVPGSRLANATVENHFRQVKRNLRPGQRLTFAEFVGNRFESVQNVLPRLVRIKNIYFMK